MVSFASGVCSPQLHSAREPYEADDHAVISGTAADSNVRPITVAMSSGALNTTMTMQGYAIAVAREKGVSISAATARTAARRCTASTQRIFTGSRWKKELREQDITP